MNSTQDLYNIIVSIVLWFKYNNVQNFFEGLFKIVIYNVSYKCIVCRNICVPSSDGLSFFFYIIFVLIKPTANHRSALK